QARPATSTTTASKQPHFPVTRSIPYVVEQHIQLGRVKPLRLGHRLALRYFATARVSEPWSPGSLPRPPLPQTRDLRLSAVPFPSDNQPVGQHPARRRAKRPEPEYVAQPVPEHGKTAPSSGAGPSVVGRNENRSNQAPQRRPEKDKDEFREEAQSAVGWA